MHRHRPGLALTAAALIALVLLSYASVKSTVMQFVMAAPAAAAMPGMDMPMATAPRTGHPAKAGHAKSMGCPYCSAAAHLPILADFKPCPGATAFVFADFRAATGHGPRGPPAFRSRARGPPDAPLTL